MSAVIVALVAAVFTGALVVWLIARGLTRRCPAVVQAPGEIKTRLDDTVVQVRRMGRGQRSLQALIRNRQQGEFIAHRTQLSQYGENLALPVGDEQRWSLLNIHGDAGVGKTYLTMQLRQIANDRGHLTVYIDEHVDDVTSVMSAIAQEFSRNGAPLSEFEKRVAAYRKCIRTIDSDKLAPDGIADFVTRMGTTLVLNAARTVPPAAILLAPAGDAAISDQANRFRNYIIRKFKSRREVELLLSPADKLTGTFVDSVKWAAGDRPISLFFDGYECTAPWLDRWLLDLYHGRYGDLPETLITTISGRYALDPTLWSGYRTTSADMYLEPLSEAEAREFLASKNITDERVVEVILSQSDRLPMWLATLAYSYAKGTGDIGDLADNPGERFLRSERDPARRAVAATGALARTFNQDTLAVVTAPDNVAESFGWLIGLPFVSRRAESWKYHEVVRSALLRFQRAQSPSLWRANHLALAQAYARWAAEAAGSPGPAWANQNWVSHTVERTYHLLCADPIGNRAAALSSAVEAQASKIAHARQWAELLADAGRDTENDDLRQWGERLREGIKDRDLTQYLTYLIEHSGLSKSTLAVAFSQRGEGHLRASRDDKALEDFSRAMELDPGLAPAVAGRGLTYLSMSRNDKAITDFNRALELNPNLASAIAGHALIYLEMTRFHEALRELNRAIELDPELDWAFSCRGMVHAVLGHPDEALADLDRATGLDPDETETIAIRGMIYAMLGQPAEGLADLDQAMKRDPHEAGVIAIRGMVSMELGHPDEALAALDQAMKRDPHETRLFAIRGMISMELGHPDEALADFDRAVERNPARAMPLFYRGITHLGLSHFDEALTDFNRALELAPDFAWALTSRGMAYLELGRLDEAFADFDHALELEPNSAETIAARGQTYYKMNCYDEALVDLNCALELDPDLTLALVFRGRSYWAVSRYDEAFADFVRVSALNPGNPDNILFRLQTYSEATRADEVFADLGLVEFNSGDEKHRFVALASFCVMLGYFDEALADLNCAIELGPDNVRLYFVRSFIYLQKGCRYEALVDFNRARELNPELVYPSELMDKYQTSRIPPNY